MANAAQTAIGGTAGDADAFVLWMSPTQTLTYSTFFGGSETRYRQGDRGGFQGLMWVAGNTQSTDLPMTGGFPGLADRHTKYVRCGFRSGSIPAPPPKFIPSTSAARIGTRLMESRWRRMDALAGGRHVFARHLDSGQSLSRHIWRRRGCLYCSHQSRTWARTRLLYASFLGGNGIDEATSLVLDPSGKIILSGYTLSPNFPVTSNALQTDIRRRHRRVSSRFWTRQIGSWFIPLILAARRRRGHGLEGRQQRCFVSVRLYRVGRASIHHQRAADCLRRQRGGVRVEAGSDQSRRGRDRLLYVPGNRGMQVAYAVDFDKSGNMYLAGYSSYDDSWLAWAAPRAPPWRETSTLLWSDFRPVGSSSQHAALTVQRRACEAPALADFAASLMSGFPAAVRFAL